jgi:copper chaperone NosL
LKHLGGGATKVMNQPFSYFHKRKALFIMKGNKLSIFSSVMIVISALLIFSSLYFPWWKMEFFAPQYPEGLNIIVYPDKLEGQIDNINALNHYIGMKNFSEANFPELQYLTYLIVGLAVLVLAAAIIRKKAYLYSVIGLFAVGGVLGVWDLRRWLRDFGTNLDPKAPIAMDPFVPPILGENIVANFTTYSLLQPGSYIVVLAFLFVLIPLWKDRRR